ncbi:MAG: ArsR family transcriptional regulator [Myxococcales bacterium]|nr:ArsR family transcriptional regulator [Myxococcales bacterium]
MGEGIQAREQAGEQPSGESLWESERIVSDTIGRLMVLWGFKRNMGRVWTVLYLAGEPLTAKQLRERLQLSSGAVSMTLGELGRWGVVRKLWVQGDRRDFYEAEANVWKMVSRVMRERERAEIVQAIEAFEDALLALERQVAARGREAGAARARVQRERIHKLIELAKLGRTMLDALISNARLDASWLPRFKLGRSR